MNTLTTQERLAESELPVDVFGASAETQPAQQLQPQQLEAEQEEQDHSKSQYLFAQNYNKHKCTRSC